MGGREGGQGREGEGGRTVQAPPSPPHEHCSVGLTWFAHEAHSQAPAEHYDDTERGSRR